MLTYLKKNSSEGLPFKLWFNAKEKDHVMIEFGGLIAKKLVCRPYNCTLYTLLEFDRRTYLGKNKEVFGFDLGDFLRMPAINQELYRSCCRVCGIVPASEGYNNNRVT